MPHFLCPRCAFLGYSAASESQCPTCAAQLGRDNQLRPAIPRAESINHKCTNARVDPGRFVRDTAPGVPEGSLK